jgi:hypothetical protein
VLENLALIKVEPMLKLIVFMNYASDKVGNLSRPFHEIHQAGILNPKFSIVGLRLLVPHRNQRCPVKYATSDKVQFACLGKSQVNRCRSTLDEPFVLCSLEHRYTDDSIDIRSTWRDLDEAITLCPEKCVEGSQLVSST